MDTLTLERVLKKIAHSYRLNEQKKLIIGVYPCDHLSFAHTLMKKDKTSAIALIVNTDPSDKPGIHWQAIWIPEASDVKQTRSCFFFDSYGRPPSNDHIKTFIKSSTQTTTWHNQQLQGFDSVCCGEWCSLFLWCMTKGCTFTSFFRRFCPKNLEQNDKQVIQLFNAIFTSKNNSKKVQQICCKYSDCNIETK